MTMMGRTVDVPQNAARLIAELEAIAAHPDRQIRAGQLLRELRPQLNGQWSAILRKLRPDLARPDAWARRCMRGSERNGLPSQPAAPPLAADSRSLGTDTTALDARAMQLFPRLRPLLALPGRERSTQIIALAAEIGSSRTTIYRWLRAIREEGARALNRKPRSDAGQVRVPPEAQQALVRRRLDPMTRHERVSVSIARVREQFPDLYLSEHSLRRVERSLPKALQMIATTARCRIRTGSKQSVRRSGPTSTLSPTSGTRRSDPRGSRGTSSASSESCTSTMRRSLARPTAATIRSASPSASSIHPAGRASGASTRRSRA